MTEQPRRVPSRSSRSEPISTAQIVETALGIVQSEGFHRLSMRRVAAALDTGQASIYVHVRNKAALDDLMLGVLSSRVTVPAPDPVRWRDQTIQVCHGLLDQYLGYPGIAQAAMAIVPTNLQTLRINEGMFAILLAAGFEAETAAWAIDALSLHVAAYALERFLAGQRGTDELDWLLDPAAIVSYFSTLPAEQFPNIRKHAVALTSGRGHERLDFALATVLDGIPHPS